MKILSSTINGSSGHDIFYSKMAFVSRIFREFLKNCLSKVIVTAYLVSPQTTRKKGISRKKASS